MIGIDKLRAMTRLFNNCNESFNQLWTVAELELIYDAYKRSEWDVPPHEWLDQELQAALRGNGSGAKDTNWQAEDMCEGEDWEVRPCR